MWNAQNASWTNGPNSPPHDLRQSRMLFNAINGAIIAANFWRYATGSNDTLGTSRLNTDLDANSPAIQCLFCIEHLTHTGKAIHSLAFRRTEYKRGFLNDIDDA